MLAERGEPDPLFVVEPLVSGRAAATLAFIRLVEPAITEDGWREFVRSYARAKPGGLMIIQDRRGYVHGLFSWRPSCSISHGRALRVADVVLPRLPGKAALRAFLEAVKRLASECGCQAVMIELGERTRHARADLESLSDTGFADHAVVWCCALPRAPT